MAVSAFFNPVISLLILFISPLSNDLVSLSRNLKGREDYFQLLSYIKFLGENRLSRLGLIKQLYHFLLKKSMPFCIISVTGMEST